MNKFFFLVATIFVPQLISAQNFAPAAGQPGSTAIHKDSSVFVGWATNCEVVRGYQNIEDPSLGYASHGHDTIAIGPATGNTGAVVSLGDGGIATLTFAQPIANGNGPDFAVFENGLNDTFLEIGFVEVSSDGTTFVRFPAISEVQTDTQIGGFGSVDCRYIHNFAGKYRVGYGTPFDLEDLIDSTGIDINVITHVRIVDVIGSIDPLYATYDSQGTIVNNLHSTPFATGGFDLDAVGVINFATLSVEKVISNIAVYPNPATDILNVTITEKTNYAIVTVLGTVVSEGRLNNEHNSINIEDLTPGIYILKTANGNSIRFSKK